MSSTANSRHGLLEAAAVATILPVVERLRAALDAENREIGARAGVDYRGHTERKNQALLELTKLKAQISQAQRHPAVAAAFVDLSTRLETNRRLLGAQLRAARTVADIVARAVRDSQSDGTYSAYPWRDD
jgi:alcohol dehydrogenase class IV